MKKIKLIFLIVVLFLFLNWISLRLIGIGLISSPEKYFNYLLITLTCKNNGGEINDSNISGFVIHNPTKICAYKFSDAGKECYDNKDCLGACILKQGWGSYQMRGIGDSLVDIKDPSVILFSDKKGNCQTYKELNACFVERRDNKIIFKFCAIE